MNIFRLTGDLSHLLAIVLLLWKIWKTRSCAGKFSLRRALKPSHKLHDCRLDSEFGFGALAKAILAI